MALILSALAVLLLVAPSNSVARCTLLWEAGIQADTLSSRLNAFPGSGRSFPVEWLPIVRQIWSQLPSLSMHSEMALVRVNPDGRAESGHIQFSDLARVCRNQLFLQAADSDSVSPLVAPRTAIKLCPTDLQRSWWYASRDTSHILISDEYNTTVYDRHTCAPVRSDQVMTQDLHESPTGDSVAAFQFVRAGSPDFEARTVIVRWSGEIVWASPWLNREHDHLHFLPDGSIYYALNYEDLVYKSPQDTAARVLSNLPYGDTRFARDGSRMLLLIRDPQHDKIAVYEVEGPGRLKEVFRRTWEGDLVTDAAVSASGSYAALMLQHPPAVSGTRCSIVILDRNGIDVLREDLTEVNPPIEFVGEFLIIGTITDLESSRNFDNRGSVRIYGCDR
jgi:hypothetical protein